MREAPRWRRLLAELLGSAFLAAIVIGSGIAAQQLSPSDTGLQLFENAAATAAGLFAIILMFGPVSGGHFNPVVSFVDAAFGGLSWSDALAYLPAQLAGCIGGAVVANIMFAEPAISISTKHRASGPHSLSEIVATVGLLLRDLRPRSLGSQPYRTGRRGCLHRGRLLLHQLDELRQPGHHRRSYVLQHLRRHRSVVGAGVHRCATRRRRGGGTGHQGPLPRRHPGRSLRCRLPPPRGEADKRFPPTTSIPNSGGDGVIDKPVVLFLCTHNAGRSLAARVLLDHYANGRIDVRSAGSEPGDQLNPSVVAVLQERGLDPTGEHPKSLTADDAVAADVIVTMGCGEACPVYPGKRYLDWNLPDPAGQPVETVRPIVDDIDRRVRGLLDELTHRSHTRNRGL